MKEDERVFENKLGRLEKHYVTNLNGQRVNYGNINRFQELDCSTKLKR